MAAEVKNNYSVLNNENDNDQLNDLDMDEAVNAAINAAVKEYNTKPRSQPKEVNHRAT